MSRPLDEPKKRRPWLRRAERAVLGVAMGVIAYVIERRVIKSIKEGEAKPVEGAGLHGVHGPEGLAVAPKKVEK